MRDILSTPVFHVFRGCNFTFSPQKETEFNLVSFPKGVSTLVIIDSEQVTQVVQSADTLENSELPMVFILGNNSLGGEFLERCKYQKKHLHSIEFGLS